MPCLLIHNRGSPEVEGLFLQRCEKERASFDTRLSVPGFGPVIYWLRSSINQSNNRKKNQPWRED